MFLEIKKIEALNLRDLSKLWQNCLYRIKHEHAKENIIKIEGHWAVNNFDIFRKNERTNYPLTGLLGYLGYRVGHDGASKTKRRMILGRLLLMEIPNLWLPDYKEKWGNPRTENRRSQLIKTLNNFAVREPSQYSFAISCWNADAEWAGSLDLTSENFILDTSHLCKSDQIFHSIGLE